MVVYKLQHNVQSKLLHYYLYYKNSNKVNVKKYFKTFFKQIKMLTFVPEKVS